MLLKMRMLGEPTPMSCSRDCVSQNLFHAREKDRTNLERILGGDPDHGLLEGIGRKSTSTDDIVVTSTVREASPLLDFAKHELSRVLEHARSRRRAEQTVVDRIFEILLRRRERLRVQRQEVSGETGDVGRSHRGARDRVDGRVARVPDREDVEAGGKQVDALAVV